MMYAYLLRKHPFTRILLAFVLGIALQSVFKLDLKEIGTGAGFLFMCWFCAWFVARNTIYNRTFTGLGILLLILMVGGAGAAKEQKDLEEAFVPLSPGRYLIQIDEIPYLRNEKIRTRGVLISGDSLDANLLPFVQLSIESDSLSRLLRPGDLIFAGLRPIRIRSDGIPEGFDYAAYLRKQEIWYQASVKQSDWLPVPEDQFSQELTFFQEVARLRHALIFKMQASGLDPPVQAFISALVLGYKKDLDPQLKEQFTSIGVVHVLAVSGLHVGIIYWVLQKVFFFLLLIKRGKLLYVGFILSALWFYVLLAGFSPSVLRAAFMFSLVLLARSSDRGTTVFNVMAASAFFILMHSPSTLFDLGFLFSYLAVAGIVIIQPVLLGWLSFKSKILSYIWTMIALSVSAQLLVTPLSIYYFHQFPLVFIVANLVMVPLVVAFIYPASLFLLMPNDFFLSRILEHLLEYAYLLIAVLSAFFESFPMAKLQELPMDSNQLILWYLLLFFLMVFILLQIPRAALVSLGVIFMLIANHVHLNYQSAKQSEMLVFFTQNDWWIILVNGRTANIVSNQPDGLLIKSKISNYLLSRKVNQRFFFPLTDSKEIVNQHFVVYSNYLIWQGKVIQLAFHRAENETKSIFPKCDFYINGFASDQIKSDVVQITRYASRKGIASYAISEQGAFYKKFTSE
jgi:competence protein ComEC